MHYSLTEHLELLDTTVPQRTEGSEPGATRLGLRMRRLQYRTLCAPRKSRDHTSHEHSMRHQTF